MAKKSMVKKRKKLPPLPKPDPLSTPALFPNLNLQELSALQNLQHVWGKNNRLVQIAYRHYAKHNASRAARV